MPPPLEMDQFGEMHKMCKELYDNKDDIALDNENKAKIIFRLKDGTEMHDCYPYNYQDIMASRKYENGYCCVNSNCSEWGWCMAGCGTDSLQDNPDK